MGSRERASTVHTWGVRVSQASVKWPKFLQEWQRLLPVKHPRQLRHQNRWLLLLLLLASFPPTASSMLQRLDLVRSPPSWKREFLELLLPSTSKKLAVSCPLETVLLVSMALRTFKQRKWWNSAPDWRAWPLTWSPTTLVLSSLVMTNLSRKVTLSREPVLLWMFPSVWKFLDVLSMLLETPLMARVP